MNKHIILAKITSARFLIAIFIALTLCFSVKEVFSILLVGIQTGDEKIMSLVEKIFMYVMGLFSGVVGSVITLYFTRQDRWKNETTEETTENKEKENVQQS